MTTTTQTLPNGFEVTLRSTLRAEMRRDFLYDRFVANVEGLRSVERSYRNIFCWVAGHTTVVKGMGWRELTEHSSDEEISKAFEEWSEVVDEPNAMAWFHAIQALLKPPAPQEQLPQEPLTEEQLSDPNLETTPPAEKPSKKKS
jgi:hypothetical protein